MANKLAHLVIEGNTYDIQDEELTSKFDGMTIELSLSNDYIITATLKDGNNTTLSTATIDLPSENSLVSLDYDNTTNEIIGIYRDDTVAVPHRIRVELDNLQEKLTAGQNISITNNTVSVLGLGEASTASVTGIATLDNNGKVPSTQLPSYVDDVIEYDSIQNFPETGETGKIYVDKTTNLTYRWSGSIYVEISQSLALGETSSTAYRGDRGKTAYDHASAKGSAYENGFYKITTNSEGHVTNATAVQKSDITALGIPAQDTTYNSGVATEIDNNNNVNVKYDSDTLEVDSQNRLKVKFPSQTFNFNEAIENVNGTVNVRYKGGNWDIGRDTTTNQLTINGKFVKQVEDLDAYTDAPNGEIVEYIGSTNAKYTNGYFYKKINQQYILHSPLYKATFSNTNYTYNNINYFDGFVYAQKTDTRIQLDTSYEKINVYGLTNTRLYCLCESTHNWLESGTIYKFINENNVCVNKTLINAVNHSGGNITFYFDDLIIEGHGYGIDYFDNYLCYVDVNNRQFNLASENNPEVFNAILFFNENNPNNPIDMLPAGSFIDNYNEDVTITIDDGWQRIDVQPNVSLTDYYTKTETDAAIGKGAILFQKNGQDITLTGSPTIVDNKTVFGANQSGTTICNIIVPTQTSELSNNSGFITKAVNDLSYYYTKDVIDTMIAPNLRFAVVQSLPSENISGTTIYLVPKSQSENQNVYDEYVYIATVATPHWEKIGDTTVDLSNYYTKTQADANFAAKSHTHTASDVSGLATVATSGNYNDLSNKPTIPTVNNATLTIQKNGTTVKTFTANASSNVTANITVPTKTSDLTNDSGYTDNIGTVTQVKVGNTAYNPSNGIVSLPAYPTDANTWRKVQLNGTDKLGTGTNTNPLNLKASTNVSITESSGTFTFAATDTKNTAGSTDTSSKIFLVGATSQADNPQTYSDDQVYVENGSLYLTRTTDASGTANNKPALIVGNPTASHVEIDGNEIMGKASDTTTGLLSINADGGQVNINGKPAGKFNSTPTSGNVVVADGTDGGMKTSSYTIAKSVPSDAVFTDTGATSVETTGSGNVVTSGSYSASNRKLSLTKGVDILVAGTDGETAISTGDDLNTYYTIGTYGTAGGSGGSTVADSLLNKPTFNGGFRLYVESCGGDGNYRRQTIVCKNGSTFVRTSTNSSSPYTWTNWEKVISANPDSTETTKYLRADGTWQVPQDTNTTYTFATGDANGQIKVTPSGGTAQNIDVYGLGNAAYTDKQNYWMIGRTSTSIPASSTNTVDLNTYVTPGNYYCGRNADAAYVTNHPSPSSHPAFNLIVSSGVNSSAYIRQVILCYNSTDLWMRYSTDTGATWSTWRNLAKDTTYSAGTGLSLNNTTFSVNYGTAANTACQGNDSRLSNARTPTAHNQASNTINAMTGYSKPSATSAITTSDTLNSAIGKLEKGLESAIATLPSTGWTASIHGDSNYVGSLTYSCNGYGRVCCGYVEFTAISTTSLSATILTIDPDTEFMYSIHTSHDLHFIARDNSGTDHIVLNISYEQSPSNNNIKVSLFRGTIKNGVTYTGSFSFITS